eukprot:260973_1
MASAKDTKKENANTQKIKYFQTAKDKQTAPILNNATIYRAKRTLQTDTDNNMIANSYYTPLKLQSNEQPTFVDALKHRIDASGKLITRSQILNTKSKHKPIPTNNTTNIQSTPTNTNTNTNNKPESIDIDTDNNTDSSSSDDFDMNNLNTLTVPKVENTKNNTDIHIKNEADDIREKFKHRLELEKQKESQNAPIIIKNPDNSDNSSVSSESEYETVTDSDEESQDNINPRKRKIQFFNRERREKYTSQTNICLEEERHLLEEFETDREDKLQQQTHDDVLNYIRDQEKLEREGDHSDDELPNDDDEISDNDTQSEFDAWKMREIKRCLRDENV